MKKINDVVNNGKAAEKFEQMVAALGGPTNLLTSYQSVLPKASYVDQIIASKNGFIKSIQTRNLGLILIELGGGRKQINDKIDFSVGYENVIDVGNTVDTSTPLATVHTSSKEMFEKVKNNIQSCFEISDDKVDRLTTIYKIIN